jgi:enolase
MEQKMFKISDIKARQVYDSRGTPTIEADVLLEGGGFGRFITPSGASVGKKEACELRDNDPDQFYGRGVKKALANIHGEIRQRLLSQTFLNQAQFDDELIKLDGSSNKQRLGANAILSVSGAFFHARASQKKQPLYLSDERSEAFLLPLPLVNVINGGVHADNKLDVQEFMLVPSGADTFSACLQMVDETFIALKNLLKSKGLSTTVGDEGGFAPNLRSDEEALDLLMTAIIKAGYKPLVDIKLALDVAAGEIYDESTKTYRINDRVFAWEELLLWYQKMVKDYPIFSIEDPFFEDDFTGFAMMVKNLGQKIQIVGDDLFVTNEHYIREGIERRLANAVLIKMNQIGTITETLQAIALCQKGNLRTVISHRSGDTEDTTIADLAVMTRAGQIKTGSMSRSERTAKYNRLLRIEEELGKAALFMPWCR